MNDNEKVIVGMILERLQANGGIITGLWNLLHIKTQNQFKQILGIDKKWDVIDIGTDTKKMKAINAFQELLK